MKKIIPLIAFVFTLASMPILFAAFPVQTEDDQKTEIFADENSELAQPAAAEADGKSQLVALLLVLFIGILGIHRFYLGYTWQGIVQLLTLGVCGIWTLIDTIRIITGDLGPKDGPYSETL